MHAKVVIDHGDMSIDLSGCSAERKAAIIQPDPCHAGGILVGYAQARHVYNRQFDRLDPKIILSTLTFALYAVVLALARRPGFRGRRTALASVAGFFLVMVTFWASIFWSGFHQFR